MQITTIGLDIAKNVFQFHGIDTTEQVIVRKQLRRGQVIKFFEAVAPCLIGMEACATAHRWALRVIRGTAIDLSLSDAQRTMIGAGAECVGREKPLADIGPHSTRSSRSWIGSRLCKNLTIAQVQKIRQAMPAWLLDKR